MKVVLFDADGVTITPPGYGADHAFLEAGLDMSGLKDYFHGPFLDAQRGAQSMRVFLDDMLPTWGWKRTTDDFLQQWFLYENVVNQQLTDRVQALRSSGIICCLASDQESERSAYIREEMKFGKLFDHLFFSCEVGSRKNEAAFFTSVYSTLTEAHNDLSKNEILFIDDDVECVETARSFGLETHLFIDTESALTRLASI